MTNLNFFSVQGSITKKVEQPTKQKLIITIGLPGSGKSYYADSLVNQYECFFRDKSLPFITMLYYNSNRDDLRLELFKKYDISKNQEKQVTVEQDKRIAKAIQDNQHIIISDTNLNPKTQEKWNQLAIKHNLELEIKDFRDVPLETCIKQDLKRDKSVGKDVIMNMYIKYIRPTLYKHNNQKENKPKAVIFDLDGTLAIMNGRSAFDWDKVDQDLPNKQVIDIALMYYANNGYEILFCSGRMDCCRQKTINWLKNNVVNFRTDWIDRNLFMRKTDDCRQDSIVKKELFLEHIDQQYNVEAVFDDREQVVILWQDLGIATFRCGDSSYF